MRWGGLMQGAGSEAKLVLATSGGYETREQEQRDQESRTRDMGGRDAAQGPRRAPERIGHSLELLRNDLTAIGHGLLSHYGPAGGASGGKMVDEGLRLLDRQVCKIAVVGQIKAGKSSLINAFVECPEFLPTNVNPFTSCVSYLHFRQSNADKASAVFRFFTAEEWDELANGGGRLRELTERLVPGFAPELLQQHVTNVKNSAIAKLGSKFERLLGKAHKYEQVSGRVLQRYVCAADNVPNSQADVVGEQYSEITKSADITLPGGPFAFPATLIDTPGTNDPFLMRDEITRRCLESSDVYLVVLTARQPLSSADVALLRILRGLHKDRIVVFVNRIDDLSDIAADSADVLHYVRERLRIEFPVSDIPVIVGSARWARAARSSNPADVKAALDRRSLAYLRAVHALPRGEAADIDLSDPTLLRGVRDALLQASGLPALSLALDRLLDSSNASHVIQQVASCFAEMARASAGATAQRLSAKETSHHATVSSAARTLDAIAQIDAELARLQSASASISQTAPGIQDRTTAILDKGLAMVRSALQQEIEAYANSERRRLLKSMASGNYPKTWVCDTDPLRKRLYDTFLIGCQHTEGSLSEVQRKVTDQLSKLLSVVVPGSEPPIMPTTGHGSILRPSVLPLSRKVAVDLDLPWWQSWWKSPARPDQHADRLYDLIKLEFGSIADDLVASVEALFGTHIDQTTRWSFTVCNVIVNNLIESQEKLRGYHTSLTNSVVGSADAEFIVEQEREVDRLRTALAEFKDASSRLAGITSAMQAKMARSQGGKR